MGVTALSTALTGVVELKPPALGDEAVLRHEVVSERVNLNDVHDGFPFPVCNDSLPHPHICVNLDSIVPAAA